MADLQSQVRVGHKRENFNVSHYSAYYSTATVLNGLLSKISGWVVAPLDPPLPVRVEHGATGSRVSSVSRDPFHQKK
jgi:hypothetical protein